MCGLRFDVSGSTDHRDRTSCLRQITFWDFVISVVRTMVSAPTGVSKSRGASHNTRLLPVQPVGTRQCLSLNVVAERNWLRGRQGESDVGERQSGAQQFPETCPWDLKRPLIGLRPWIT